jgi:hypothetical protein
LLPVIVPIPGGSRETTPGSRTPEFVRTFGILPERHIAA